MRLFSTEAIAEMIACGTVAFSDMYFLCTDTARAALDSGIKLNIARSVVSFDEDADPAADYRVAEALELYREWNGEGDGRIKVDFSLHAEYTNTPRMCEYLADLAHKYDAGMQIHLSETEGEHLRCIEKYSVTPAAFFPHRGRAREKDKLRSRSLGERRRYRSSCRKRHERCSLPEKQSEARARASHLLKS